MKWDVLSAIWTATADPKLSLTIPWVVLPSSIRISQCTFISATRHVSTAPPAGWSFRREAELTPYVLANLDLDGYADLAFVSPEGLSIFHGGPDGLAPDRYSILPSRGEMTHYVLVGDFNHDGWLDLLAVAYTYDDKPETLANSSVIFYGSPDASLLNARPCCRPTAAAMPNSPMSTGTPDSTSSSITSGDILKCTSAGRMVTLQSECGKSPSKAPVPAA